MNVIVVDDELVSRKKMEKIMSSIGDCRAFHNGKDAIKAFEDAWMAWKPVDLITLDISMPEMDGTEVLHAIRTKEADIPKEKRVKIIMVTSHKDKDTIITSVQAGCDDYVTKPFDKDIIIQKLESVGFSFNGDDPEEGSGAEADSTPGASIDTDGDNHQKTAAEMMKPLKTRKDIIAEIKSRFEQKDIDLPAYSGVAMKFRELVDNGNDVEEIADLLRNDPAITSKLISVSNSTYYRGMEENKTLEQTINRLGFDVTSQYVDVICNRTLFADADKAYARYMEKLWSHSLACANASQIVAETLAIDLPEDPFMIGLLHDIGKLILLKVFGELEREMLLDDGIEETDYLATLNQLHTGFGIALLKRWNFSDEFIEIVRYHDNLKGADPVSKGLLVVHFSNLLVKSMGYDFFKNPEIDLMNAESTHRLKLDTDTVEEIRQKIKTCMNGLEKILV